MKLSKKRILLWCFSFLILSNVSSVYGEPFFIIEKVENDDEEEVTVARPIDPILLTDDQLQGALQPDRELDDPSVQKLDLSGCQNLTKIPRLVYEHMYKEPFYYVCSDGVDAQDSLFDQCYAASSAGLGDVPSDEPSCTDRSREAASLAGDFSEKLSDDMHVQFVTKHKTVGLPNVSILNLNNCKNIITLPDLSRLRALESLYFKGCYQLRVLPPLPMLRELVIGKGENIVDFSALQSQHELRVLKLNGCQFFTNADALFLENCVDLETLSLNGCVKFSDVSVFARSTLTHLETLSLKNCPNINDLSSLVHLPELTMLKLKKHIGHDDKNFEELGLGMLTLKTLRFVEFDEVEDISFLRGLSATLESLCLGGCLKFKNASVFSEFKMLDHLDLGSCSQLEDFSFLTALNHDGTEVLPNLKTISFDNCRGLKSCPDFSKRKRLRKLYLSNCHNLHGQLLLPKKLLELHLAGLNLTTQEESYLDDHLDFLSMREIGQGRRFVPCLSIYNLSLMCPQLRLLNLQKTNLTKYIDKKMITDAASGLDASLVPPDFDIPSGPLTYPQEALIRDLFERAKVADDTVRRNKRVLRLQRRGNGRTAPTRKRSASSMDVSESNKTDAPPAKRSEQDKKKESEKDKKE